jgi:hypothetical protein
MFVFGFDFLTFFTTWERLPLEDEMPYGRSDIESGCEAAVA